MQLQKDDPLKRIQEEINEVARREHELRAKSKLPQSPTGDHDVPIPAVRHHLSTDNNISNVSDDSGISSSSSPINGTSTNSNHHNSKDMHYIRNPSTIKLNGTSTTVQSTTQKLTRAMSTPQIFVANTKLFNTNSVQKGMMQRFIASRGKIAASNNRFQDILVGTLSFLVSQTY